MEIRKTTIQVTERTRFELLTIKGELLRKDGVDRAFDDVIQELIYYWTKGVKNRATRSRSVLKSRIDDMPLARTQSPCFPSA